jgi:nucleoside-diphosphate-sugar epimerase
MRVVVTGGSGRVGEVTVRALTDAGREVLIVDTSPPTRELAPGASFVHASATDFDELRAACRGADAIVHLAGISKPAENAPQFVHNTNVVASYNVLCAAVELGISRVVMASSVNAIGLTWSRDPTFDYFPVDEKHVTRNEDPYSLSKWVGELQADSIVRLHPELSVASLRLHMFMTDRAEAVGWNVGEYADGATRGLWGYTTHRMWIDAFLSALTAKFTGHERFFIVAERNVLREPARELSIAHFPNVQLRESFTGDDGFFDCRNAREILSWSGNDE